MRIRIGLRSGSGSICTHTESKIFIYLQILIFSVLNNKFWNIFALVQKHFWKLENQYNYILFFANFMATGSRRAKSVFIHADPNPNPEHYLLTEFKKIFISKFCLFFVKFLFLYFLNFCLLKIMCNYSCNLKEHLH